MRADGSQDEVAGAPRLSVVDALEGFYVTLVLDGLYRAGVLDALAAGTELDRIALDGIARERGFDRDVLAMLLEYAALRSDLVDVAGHGEQVRYSIGPGYQEARVAHLLDQYVGGFGPCLRDLDTVLSDARGGAGLVDYERHARAFARTTGRASAPRIIALAAELDIGVLLDAGCGGGQLLTAIAERRPSFRGIGIDANPSAVTRARHFAAERGLAERIAFVCGDVLAADRLLSEQQRADVEAIAAVSVVNAYCAGRPGRTVDDFLFGLRALFPNRIVFLADYYGRLGAVREQAAAFQRTLVHDLAQVVSGQGVPPADLETWRAIYARTACTLIGVHEAEGDGIRGFLHVLQL